MAPLQLKTPSNQLLPYYYNLSRFICETVAKDTGKPRTTMLMQKRAKWKTIEAKIEEMRSKKNVVWNSQSPLANAMIHRKDKEDIALTKRIDETNLE